MRHALSRRTVTALLGGAPLLGAGLARAPARSAPSQAEALTPEDAQKIAIDAYVYGYALMTSEITRRAFVNVTAPSPRTLQAPMGQLVSQPMYPPADYKGVTAPNADTLYSVGFVDVSDEPWIFSYPDMHGRYFLFPIYSLWTEVLASPGARTLGTGAQTIAITGPGWSGSLPKGVTQVVTAPTGTVFMIGRVYADGSAEGYASVHALQRAFKLTPLHAWGEDYAPSAGTVEPHAPSPKEIVRDLIAGMDTQSYFGTLASVMGKNPPVLASDQPMVAEMAKIGLVPGQAFDLSKLGQPMQAALKDVGKLAYAKIDAAQTKLGRFANGWSIPEHGGIYGANYLARAAISAFGWGANQLKDAVYPFTRADADGKSLSGANKYIMHFPKGEMPPVDGFWSITMYDTEFYFCPNALDKLTISRRDQLRYNADGSLDLYFQHDSPGSSDEANWLPAPTGDFILMMRLYWPTEKPPSILDGGWSPSPVRRVI